ncbi:MAG: insulinase family protein [Motiliproteus sp.]
MIRLSDRFSGLLLPIVLLTCLVLSIHTIAATRTAVDADLRSQSQSGQIIQSPNDNNHYLAFDLDNGLKVVVISDPDADKAAASLEVGVGSGDDPRHTQGLAHFLEHMLFLGTDKFPEAGEYQAYISKHGGSHNAFTAHDRTNYFFDIDQSKLEPALDRFSRFFVAPLFTPEYVDRERNAVHSEYQSKLKEDGRRSYAVMREAINPEHPLTTFAVGSLDTLKDNNQGTLIENLKRFYGKHYQAPNMSLVILGREPVEQLKAMVEQRFSPIYAVELVKQTTAAEREAIAKKAATPLFTPGSLPAQLQIKSLKELRQLSLTFPVPPIRSYYDRKPLSSISALIGHEGEGSVLAELKHRGWATSLSAGPGFDFKGSATLSVNVDLTPAGLENYHQVTDLLFQQINLIRQQGITDWRFAEQQQLSEIGFRFREPSSPVYQVLRLASKLRQYPQEQLLQGDYLLSHFDPKLIHDYLGYLRPDNMLLTLTSADIDTDQVEPRYQAEYSLQPLSQEFLAQLQHSSTVQTRLDSALTMPAPNPFIPQDLTLLPPAGMNKPELLVEQDGYKLWYQQDDEFRVPKADFYFSFRSPVANNSPQHHLMSALLVRLIDDRLNAFLYPAAEAGLSINIYPHIRGFSSRISGYSDSQQPLLKQIIGTINSLHIDPDKLAIFKQDMRRQLENKTKDKPYNQGFDALYLRVLNPRWSTEQQLAVLDGIDVQALQQFKTALMLRGEVEAMAHGNLSRPQTLALSQQLQQQLLSEVEPVNVAQATARQLTSGSETIELEIDHNDSSLIVYLQAEQKSLPLRARYGLLARVLEAPFYTEVRTEKQRGYVVFATPMPIQQHPALAFIVQSPSASPDTLMTDIDSFLSSAQILIESLDETQLETFKQGLVTELMKKEQKLNQRSNRYWQEIDQQLYDFDSREQLVEEINAVTKQQLLDTFSSLPQRKLLVRSTGSGAQSTEG